MEAAFFDLDKTVIARASMAAFGHTFYRGGLISRPTVVRALVVAARLPPPGRERAEAGQDPGVGPGLTRGWDQTQVSRHRPRGPRRGGRAHHLRRGPRAHRAAPGRRAARPTSSRPRPRRSCSRWPSTWGSTGPSPAGPWSTSTAATRARWPSTPTGPFKAEAIRAPRRSSKASTWPGRTPTATPTPTSPCSRSSATPSPSTPTGCWPGWPATAAGSPRSSPGPCGYATVCRFPTCPLRRRRPGWPSPPPVRLFWSGATPAADRRLTGQRTAEARPPPAAQASRSRLAATRPRATRMARISSFFTSADPTHLVSRHRPTQSATP